jgi:2-(1,2-epoxy-1,2-dihydrophenyl)acetyl-CoA isomerase
MLSASEALAIGLVSEMTATDDEFEQRFLEYGQMLASVAPIAARQTKRLLVRVDQPHDLAEHLDDEIALALQGLASEDSKEAIRAMVARERPEFTGR